ncbi:hypothetical protein [Absidia glauca]|uniref:CBM21 domain-containing protein n=1 Tax=Absidia glauca TaxID=4829 RepID=A0A163J3U6_ABSGL|nr:hypothetical protein [Absidia glauca]
MSFTIFPRHSKYGNSSWKRQVVLNRSVNNNKEDDASSLSAPTSPRTTDQSASDGGNDNAATMALLKRRSLEVKLDPTLYQRLQQDSGQGLPLMESNTDTKKKPTVSISDNNNNNQVRKLKSSLRQVVSAPTSPQHGPSRGGKSVKFDPFHLEKVCFFEGSHSPNEVPRYEDARCPPFKVLYSHWPPIQHTLFQHQQNVQLKRSLKVLEGGSILRGQVMVRNLGYEKDVEIRYTLDGWQTVKNVKAGYLQSRGSLDMFVYEIDIEQGMADRGYIRVTVDMAVRYSVVLATTDHKHLVEETYWDNNDGHNYQVLVVESSDPQPLPATIDTASTIKTNPLDDGTTDLLPTTSSSSSASSAASYRYDFGQSLLKAKHQTKPALSSPLSSAPASPCSSPPLSTSPSIPPSPISDSITINKSIPVSPSPFDNAKFTSQRQTQSAPSSPESSSLMDFFQSSGAHSLASSSYSDLVKKYCFYGSQDSSSPALSING